MEQVLFRLHVRFITAFSEKISTHGRAYIEKLSLLNACLSLTLLILLHNSYIVPTNYRRDNSRSTYINCLTTDSTTISTPNIVSINQWNHQNVSILKINIHDEFNFKSYMSLAFEKLGSNTHNNDVCVKRSYLYSPYEKGFLAFAHHTPSSLNISVQEMDVSSASTCLGPPWQRWILRNVVGYDSVVINWVIDLASQLPNSKGVMGYFRNLRSKDAVEVYTRIPPIDQPMWTVQHLASYVSYRCGLLSTILFIFFLSTTIVSFILRETQVRMLKFTFILHYRIRHDVPYTDLVVTHVIETFIFIPLMIGIMFFLNEFYSGDRLLAFLALSVVWMAEVFSVICARTLLTARYFPRIFLLYYILFHTYVFIYPFGFSYLALTTMVLFMEHVMFFFWCRYELPALYLGKISPRMPRQITGDVIGHSIHSSSSIQAIATQFTTDASVLEDEIELSRRIQQQQMVDLFLGAEVRHREAQSQATSSRTAPVAVAQSSPVPVRRNRSASPTRRHRSAMSSPLHRFGAIPSSPLRSLSTDARSSRQRAGSLHPEPLDRRAAPLAEPSLPLPVSYSSQSLFDFASSN